MSGAAAPARARLPGSAPLVEWGERHRVLGTWLALAALPLLPPSTALATSVVAYGLYALGFNLLFGCGGLLCCGHAELLADAEVQARCCAV